MLNPFLTCWILMRLVMTNSIADVDELMNLSLVEAIEFNRKWEVWISGVFNAHTNIYTSPWCGDNGREWRLANKIHE